MAVQTALHNSDVCMAVKGGGHLYCSLCAICGGPVRGQGKFGE